MKLKSVFILTISLLFISSFTFAETIILKSGKIIKGKIVERADGEVKVDIGIGFPITYYLSEVESIDGKLIKSSLSHGNYQEQIEKPLYKKREFDFSYTPDMIQEDIVTIRIIGNPIGDNELIRDAIRAIERVIMMTGGKEIFSKAEVEHIRSGEEGTIDIEKWTVEVDGKRRQYWVKYDFTPPEDFPYKVLIMASEREPEI
ncbi:MAG: hypothetical protein ABIA97_06580 [Candidatus Omnitrophota bacterium]